MCCVFISEGQYLQDTILGYMSQIVHIICVSFAGNVRSRVSFWLEAIEINMNCRMDWDKLETKGDSNSDSLNAFHSPLPKSRPVHALLCMLIPLSTRICQEVSSFSA